MPAAQPLLFPDPQPLVERLGRDFFRTLPEVPGVYLMKDAGDKVLYVGKAKNLRKRLGSYRVANPDRMPRRHLRLVRSVTRIELIPCPDEKAALSTEAELLRTLRPKFNRAGTWPGPARYVAWRWGESRLVLAVSKRPLEDWDCYGPLGWTAIVIREALARLTWLGVHPGSGFHALPCGWFHGRFEVETEIDCGIHQDSIATALESLRNGDPGPFSEWVRAQLSTDLSVFAAACLEGDLDVLGCLPSSALRPPPSSVTT